MLPAPLRCLPTNVYLFISQTIQPEAGWLGSSCAGRTVTWAQCVSSQCLGTRMATRAGSARLEVRKEQPWGCRGLGPGSPRLPCAPPAVSWAGIPGATLCCCWAARTASPRKLRWAPSALTRRRWAERSPPGALGPVTAGPGVAGARRGKG